MKHSPIPSLSICRQERRTIATTSLCMVIVARKFSHGTKSTQSKFMLWKRSRLNLNLHTDKDIENINLKIR